MMLSQDRFFFVLSTVGRNYDEFSRKTISLFYTREIPEEELSFGDYLEKATFHLKAVFAKSEKHRLIKEYGIDSYTVCQDEKLLFERDFASYENMREWIFSFGDKVSVSEPKELQNDRIKIAISATLYATIFF